MVLLCIVGSAICGREPIRPFIRFTQFNAEASGKWVPHFSYQLSGIRKSVTPQAGRVPLRSLSLAETAAILATVPVFRQAS
jgi:hypothetical protein